MYLNFLLLKPEITSSNHSLTGLQPPLLLAPVPTLGARYLEFHVSQGYPSAHLRMPNPNQLLVRNSFKQLEENAGQDAASKIQENPNT